MIVVSLWLVTPTQMRALADPLDGALSVEGHGSSCRGALVQGQCDAFISAQVFLLLGEVLVGR